MRRPVFRVTALIAVALLALLLFALPPDLIVGFRSLGHRLVVKAYFPNALGLRAGAPVHLAGVDIGSVKSVRTRPELKSAPVEVVMVLTPSYELKIPSDSTVVLATAGVLGETFVDIDATSASGPPIATSAVLQARPSTQPTADELIEKLTDALAKKNCDCDTRKDAAAPDPEPQKSRSNKPSH